MKKIKKRWPPPKPAAPAVPDDKRLLEVWSWCRQSGADFKYGNSVNHAKLTVFMSVADHIKHKYFGACRDTNMIKMLTASRKDAAQNPDPANGDGQ